MYNLRSRDTLKRKLGTEEETAHESKKQIIAELDTLEESTLCTSIVKSEETTEKTKKKTVIKIITRKKSESSTSVSTTGGTVREAPKKITLKINPSKKPCSCGSDATIPLSDTTVPSKKVDGDSVDEQPGKEPGKLIAYNLSWFNYHTRRADQPAGCCPDCAAEWRTEEWVIGLPDSLHNAVEVPPDREWHRSLYILATLAI
ncbi:hypothetical protein FSARC_6412, partial [Fusarium sarcochroum]